MGRTPTLPRPARRAVLPGVQAHGTMFWEHLGLYRRNRGTPRGACGRAARSEALCAPRLRAKHRAMGLLGARIPSPNLFTFRFQPSSPVVLTTDARESPLRASSPTPGPARPVSESWARPEQRRAGGAGEAAERRQGRADAMVVPVVVGVGRTTQRRPERLEDAADPIELSAVATRLALQDAGLSAGDLDAAVFVRTLGELRIDPSGRSTTYKNPAQSVANKLGVKLPKDKLFRSEVGGNMPQLCINELAEMISKGLCDCALLTGAEAIDTLMRARKQKFELSNSQPTSEAGKVLHWGDDGDHLDEPQSMGDPSTIVTVQDLIHGLVDMPPAYALMEQALRVSDGVSEENRRLGNGRLFSGYSKTAVDEHNKSHSWFPRSYEPQEIAEPAKDNRWVATPYTKRMCAVMDVNQAASIIIMSDVKAKALGVPQSKMVYLHGSGDTSDVAPALLHKPQLDRCPGMKVSGEQALNSANVPISQISFFDIYSCFPVAVRLACREIGIDRYIDIEEDSHRLTVTGGLPFHGGPGNNYSAHGIVAIVERLRQNPGAFGLVTANGGVVSKHAAGVYSTVPYAVTHPNHPDEWRRPDCKPIMAQIRKETPPRKCPLNPGDAKGVITNYTVKFKSFDKPHEVTAIGDITSGPHAGDRFVAVSSDKAVVQAFLDAPKETDLINAAVQLQTSNAFGKKKLFKTTFVLQDSSLRRLAAGTVRRAPPKHAGRTDADMGVDEQSQGRDVVKQEGVEATSQNRQGHLQLELQPRQPSDHRKPSTRVTAEPSEGPDRADRRSADQVETEKELLEAVPWFEEFEQNRSSSHEKADEDASSELGIFPEGRDAPFKPGLLENDDDGRSRRKADSGGGTHIDAKGAQQSSGHRGKGKEDGELKLLAALVNFQKQFRKYEEARTQAKLNTAATKIQTRCRVILAKARLPKRCAELRVARTKQAAGLLRGFLVTSNKEQHRIEAYDALCKAIATDLTFQDALTEAISVEMLESMQEDLYVGKRSLRLAATKFFCDFAHKHRANQRLLCGLNGITVGNIRLMAVSVKFERQYVDWCRSNNAEVTYEGTVDFVSGMVQTASAFYANTAHLESKNRSMRSSIFSYPRARSYEELDPAKALVGIYLCSSPPAELHDFETSCILEMRDIFEEGAAIHKDPPSIFDQLVPALPQYSLLLAIKRRLKRKLLSEPLRRFLGSSRRLMAFAASGKEVSIDSAACFGNNLPDDVLHVSDEMLRLAARLGINVLWGAVAEELAGFLTEDQVHLSLGASWRASAQTLFTDAAAQSSKGHFPAPVDGFVRRIDLCKQLDGSDHLSMRQPLLRWRVLGCLAAEHHMKAVALSSFHDANLPGYGVRCRVQGAEHASRPSSPPSSGLGSGQCNWDWISWHEFLSHCRIVLCSDDKERVAVPSRKVFQRLKRSVIPTPIQIGNTARRVKILQKMLRRCREDYEGARRVPLFDSAKRVCLENELLILSKVLGSTLPILSPAHIGPAPKLEKVPCRAKMVDGEALEYQETSVPSHGHVGREAANPGNECQGDKKQPRRPATARLHRDLSRHKAHVRLASSRRKQVQALQEIRRKDREALRAKMDIKWAIEETERERKKLERQRHTAGLKRDRFKKRCDEVARALSRKKRQQHRDVSDVEIDAVPAEELRKRMEEYDNYVRVRNQLVMAQPGAGGSQFCGVVRPESAGPNRISSMALSVAPVWALSDMRQPRRCDVDDRDDASIVDRPADWEHPSLAHKPEQRKVQSVGGYFMKVQDVRKALEKEFTVEEIKCSR
ncbi:Uncharacterized protein SCF082_LOCUS46071 [Durusdinium trenchii]|uniref:Uncharacterized protein n=1 Tax=Durusdinium trenchii TaxID=1381693 RepID=A0ABP0RDQ2_9DINO